MGRPTPQCALVGFHLKRVPNLPRGMMPVVADCASLQVLLELSSHSAEGCCPHGSHRCGRVHAAWTCIHSYPLRSNPRCVLPGKLMSCTEVVTHSTWPPFTQASGCFLNLCCAPAPRSHCRVRPSQGRPAKEGAVWANGFLQLLGRNLCVAAVVF